MPTDGPETRQIEPELLQRLGRLIVEWSYVEILVQDVFAWATGGERGIMNVVTKNVSLGSITGWLRTVANVKNTPPDLYNELLEILDEVDALRAERNALVHGLWGTDASPPMTAMSPDDTAGARRNHSRRVGDSGGP